MYNRKLQPVSFNLGDPFESELYNFAMTNGSYSKYIKRLIQLDMERKELKKASAQVKVIHAGTNALNGFVLKS
jgi:hypothetical protein